MLSCYFASRKSNKRDGYDRFSSAHTNGAQCQMAVSSFYTINRTQSEANDGSDRSVERPRPSANNPYKDQIEQLQKELDEPCQACMYTGMAVCTGLSVYFVKLATDETTLPKNRRFLWACSAGSVVAGAYRWYLG
jgi:hypothetical protein